MKKPHSAERTMVLVLAILFMVKMEAGAAPDYKQILGDWKSNYGPVHVDFLGGETPPGSAVLKGFWLEPPGDKRGEIQVGHYDSKTGELALEYLETWSKKKGRIKLKLDAAGKTFTGSFKNDDGTTGTWTWTRK